MNETRFPTIIELSPDEDHAGDLIVDDQRHQLKVVVQQSDAPGADFANLFLVPVKLYTILLCHCCEMQFLEM
ncbi:MAG: hypothetical protein IJ566_08240 [Cardiobacteriaceae bacterium]|nr:hypothetical protein [Cardiobacteriaceae bacterium]